MENEDIDISRQWQTDWPSQHITSSKSISETDWSCQYSSIVTTVKTKNCEFYFFTGIILDRKGVKQENLSI